MKVQVTFKTPDAVVYALHGEIPEGTSMEDAFEMKENALHVIRKWVKYGELVTIEFDTDAGTATVLPCSR